jgi:hypothetical protein
LGRQLPTKNKKIKMELGGRLPILQGGIGKTTPANGPSSKIGIMGKVLEFVFPAPFWYF